MAEQTAHDVVKEALSVDAPSFIDDIATSSTPAFAGSGQASTETNPLFGNDQVHNIEIAGLGREFAKSPLSEKASQAEASGGSDTDTSRTDGLKDAAGGHVRSNSVKKPTTFKSVSVTKNFLAKAAVGGPNIKSSDKASSAQPTPTLSLNAKPRLVAKSALGGLGSRSGLSGTKGPGTGPDASKVWNKNRVVPPQAARQFTDEELKQQYGIHMATRLPADEGGEGSKWADIDDDEEDWAPDTVEWMDGTKSTVAATDAQQPPPGLVEDQKPVQVAVAEPMRPVLSVPQQPSSAGVSVKTILKPHVPLPTKPTSLVLKGGPEKPDSASKAPAPNPAKSPWASLPPVDKMPLVVPNPPVQQGSRFQRDPNGFDGFPPPPSPKEIAADDFDRSNWRDEPPRARELYNSQSGRFEPANEPRRGSLRNDGVHRQPALLQRPLQNQSRPAEPSAAFQTSRSGAEGGSWPRNRTGSNVSIGSGGRRMSFGRPQDLQSDRTEGVSPTATSVNDFSRAVFSDHPASHGSQNHRVWMRTSPAVHHAQPAMESNQEGHPTGEVQPVETMAPPPEDPVAVQQRLMREKIEQAKLAKQLRQEEEEREEAARKERLRLKMDALAAATPPPPTVSTENKIKDVASSPQMTKPMPLSSPPKPPVPSSEGEIAQYGLMKVHQPHPVKKLSAIESSLLGRPRNEVSQDPRKQFSDQHSQALGGHGHRVPVIGDKGQKSIGDNRRGAGVQQPEAAPWRSAGPSENYGNNYSGWSNNNTSNVWGPPQAKDRALGNGTFDSNAYTTIAGTIPGAPTVTGTITGASTIAGATASSSSIGSSTIGAGAPASLQVAPGSHVASTLQKQRSPIAPPSSHSQPPIPLHTSSSAHAASSDRNIFSDHSIHHEHLPTTSQPTNTFNRNSTPAVMTASGAKFSTADWNALPDQIQSTEKAQASAFLAVVKARQQKAASQHSPYDLIQQNTSRYEKAMTLVPASKTDENTTVTTNVNISRNQSNVPRESRFFPRADAAQASEKSDSPPPPEVSSLDKTQKNPVVNLPKPQAVVKLPPAKASPQKTSIVPVAQHAPRGSSQTLVEPENLWQNRFDTLFGRDSKDTTEPVTVNSSSRAPLSQSKLPSAATVSLPLIKTEANTGPSSDVLELQSKPTDEDLFPQQEFGSRPVISLPKALHLNAHLPPSHYNQSRAGLRGQPKQVDVVSKPELKFQPEKSNTITAHLPGREAKTIPLVQSRTNSNGSRGYRSSINNWNSKKSNGQGGNRSYSGSFNQNASATNHSRGGRTNSGAFGHNVDHSSGEFEPLQDGYGRGSSGNGQQGTSPRNYGRGSQRNNGSRGGTYWPKRNVSTTPSATISN